MAGAAAVTLGALGFYFLAPSGYIALDLNPSIEIRTNRLDQVVSVKAVNEDAKRLLADYKLTDHDPVSYTHLDVYKRQAFMSYDLGKGAAIGVVWMIFLIGFGTLYNRRLSRTEFYG